MLKWLSRWVLAVLVLSSGFVTAAVMAGYTMETDVIALALDHYPPRWPPGPQPYFKLADMKRLVALKRPLRLPDIHHIDLLWEDGRFGLIYTGKGTAQDDRTQRLYLYDFTDGSLTLLNRAAKALGIYAPEDYNVTLSPQGDRMAFIDPRASAIYVYDLQTRQQHKISQGSTVFEDFAWSPDGTRIAARALQSLYIFHLGSQTTQYFQQDFSGFQVFWSQDGRSLMLRATAATGGASLPPLRIIDAASGAVHPSTQRFSAGFTAWGCNGTRLAYLQNNRVIIRDEPERDINRRTIKILDLNTGETIDLGNFPELDARNVHLATWLPDCGGLLVSTIPLGTAAAPSTRRDLSLFLVEPDASAVYKLAERASPTIFENDSAVVYEITQDDGRHTYHRLQPDGSTAELGIASAVVGWPQWVDESGWVLYREFGASTKTDRATPLAAAWLDGSPPFSLTRTGELLVSYAVWR